MTINQAIILAEKMISKYPELRKWSVTFNKRKRSFGVCNYSEEQIELSALLIPAMTESAIKETIIHEISHALTKGHHNHDKIWKKKCIELGGNGQRCGGNDKYKNGHVGRQIVEQRLAKYTLTCPVCASHSYRNRKPTRSISCGKCNSRVYDPKYKLIVTQNY